MSSNNLPRLENNASNRNTFWGGLQIALGIGALGCGLVVLILRFILHRWVGGTPFAIALWLLVTLGVWFLCVGLNRLIVNSTFRRLIPRLQGGEFTVEKHAELLGTTVPQLLKDLSSMRGRRYWNSMTILDDAIVIVSAINTPSQEKVYKILAGEGMRFNSKLQGQLMPHPALAVFLVGLVLLLNPSFLTFLWVIAAVVVSFPLHRLTGLFMPKQEGIEYNKIPQYIPDKIELALSGNEQADQLIGQAEKHLIQLQDLQLTIKDEHLNARIREISTGTKQMTDRLRQAPQKYRQVRQTMDYSLPTAINLFYKYKELDAQPVKGENIQRSMAKIHEMSDLVAATFTRELDSLYQDQTLDIEVDIEVMRNMMQGTELDFTPMASFRRGESDVAPAPDAPATAAVPPVLSLPQEDDPLSGDQA